MSHLQVVRSLSVLGLRRKTVDPVLQYSYVLLIWPCGSKKWSTRDLTNLCLWPPCFSVGRDHTIRITSWSFFSLEYVRLATTDSTVRPSAPHPRDRTATSDKGSSQTTSDETASAPAPAVKKPPTFGLGMGGLAGGGLLAEMKQRQERAASLKKVSKVI